MAESLVFLGVRQSPVGDDGATVYGQYTVARFYARLLLLADLVDQYDQQLDPEEDQIRHLEVTHRCITCFRKLLNR